MRKLLIVLILIFLSGCGGIYNLNDFIMPDDLEFLAIVESLDTPEKICDYMKDNFNWEFHISSYSPYQMWLENVKTKAGDCNDMSCFAIFVAHYHGYETYQISLRFKGTTIGHSLGVFVEDGKYTSSSNTDYYPRRCNTFGEIVKNYTNNYKSYKVYDYEMNVIEYGSRR